MVSFELIIVGILVLGCGFGIGYMLGFFRKRAVAALNLKDKLYQLDYWATLGQLASGFEFHEPSKNLETHVCETIQVMINDLQPKIKPRNIEISSKFLDPIPWALIPETSFRQVMLNLLVNSIEALPMGGKIMIRVVTEDNMIKLEIEDNGVGISSEYMTKIFEPFFTTKPKGTGLGLTTCKDLIEKYRGKILVKSIENGGTTITLLIPGRTL